MNTSWIWLSPLNTSATADGPATMQAPTAAPDAAPAAAAARTTGLDTPFKSVGGASKKRAAPVMMPLRTGKIWNTVTVVGKELTTTPSLVCKDCGHPFCGGNTRIVEHILNKCTCSTSELQALRTELLTEKEKKAGKAAAKAAVNEAVNEAAESKPIATGALPAPQPVGLAQMGLSQSFNQCTSEDMDKAIADLVYGKNLSFDVVCSAPVSVCQLTAYCCAQPHTNPLDTPHRLIRPSSKRCSPQPAMRRRRTSRRTGSGWDAGYKAPVEKWDTYSDSSDGSDDELDLAV